MMSESISPEEIDDLLEQEELEVNVDEYDIDHTEKSVVTYDFRRPNRISKEQLRSIRSMHNKFARELSSRISSSMRTIIEITLHSVDQMTYGEFLMSLPSPTSFNIFSMKPLEGSFILEINPSVIFPVVDRMLGGHGEPFDASREFTDIEFLMIDNLLGDVTTELKNAWGVYLDIAPAIESKESSPNVIQVVAQNEFIVMCVFEVIIGNSTGMMNICYPVIYLEPILQKLSNRDILMYDRKSQKSRNREIRTLASASTSTLEAIIGTTTLPLSKVLSLSKNEVILFNRSSKDPIIVRVNNKDLYRAGIGSNEYRKVIMIRESIETEKDRTKELLRVIEEERGNRMGVSKDDDDNDDEDYRVVETDEEDEE